MSFDQDWAALRADSATRINSAGPAAATAVKPDLNTGSVGMGVAAMALETTLLPGTKRAGGAADDATSGTVREFTGWATGSGLKDAHEEWEAQVKALEGRLANDKSALQGSARDFGNYNHELTATWATLIPQRPGEQ
ncbi:hypothetical protein AB0M39_17030 [Streptomyces sp. NPDC051907]|uniref:hypothetical protein n=1 Tax=Streptomyces sp. NPDC051907 TaxID=3155284 RepID=UPI003422BC30